MRTMQKGDIFQFGNKDREYYVILQVFDDILNPYLIQNCCVYPNDNKSFKYTYYEHYDDICRLITDIFKDEF